MTREQMQELKDGTILYNGRTEAEVKMVDGEKVLEILIPIENARPEEWEEVG